MQKSNRRGCRTTRWWRRWPRWGQKKNSFPRRGPQLAFLRVFLGDFDEGGGELGHLVGSQCYKAEDFSERSLEQPGQLREAVVCGLREDFIVHFRSDAYIHGRWPIVNINNTWIGGASRVEYSGRVQGQSVLCERQGQWSRNNLVWNQKMNKYLWSIQVRGQNVTRLPWKNNLFQVIEHQN